jgi:hypothetical protein
MAGGTNPNGNGSGWVKALRITMYCRKKDTLRKELANGVTHFFL